MVRRFLRPLRAAIPPLVFVLVSLVLVGAARAIDTAVVVVENTTGSPAADLHVTFTGTGGNLNVDPLEVVALGCPTPTVSIDGTGTIVTIDWGVACVADEENVIIVARTANGPLAAVYSEWTDINGAVIAPGNIVSSTSIPVPPSPFPALKVLSRYEGGERVYTHWRIVNNGNCWGRWCWRYPRWCYTKVVFCPFGDRFGRLFEIGPWIPVTPWIHSAFADSLCRWEEVTIPHPDLGGPPSGNYKGPKPNGWRDDGWPFVNFDVMDPGYEARYSDTGGNSYRPAADFASAFQQAADALWIKTNNFSAPDPNTTLATMTMAMAPGFQEASLALTPLIAELQDVNLNEPSALIANIKIEIELIQLSLVSISNVLATGNPAPGPFTSLGQATANLATYITQVPGARFDNAAASLLEASAAASHAASMILLGLVTPANASGFIYDAYVRLRDSFSHFATAMYPHVRVQVAFGTPYTWYPGSLEAVRIRIMRTDTQEIVEEDYRMLSCDGTFDVPIIGLEGLPLRIWFKLPTHLSVTFDTPAVDGTVLNSPPLIGGDADGDNCIDQGDIDNVQHDYLTGGASAPLVMPSDVDGNGLINLVDLTIVSGNQGQCGSNIITGIHPPHVGPAFEVRAQPNPFLTGTLLEFNLPGDARVSIKVYNARGQLVDVVADDVFYNAGPHAVPFTARSMASGVYFCRVSAALRGGEVRQQVIKMSLVK